MASIISASTTSNTALNMTADTTGVLQLATGATPTTAVTVDASQNVGIGTASPSAKLNVNGGNIDVTGSATPLIRIIENTTTGNPKLQLLDYSNASSPTEGTELWYESSTGNSYLTSIFSGGGLIFRTGGTNERMRIDSSGRVTTPSQPAFIAGIAATSDASVASGAFVPFNTTALSSGACNIGSHFSTTTYKFTAPVAGTYLFTYTFYYTNSGSSTLNMQPCINVNSGYPSFTSGDAYGVNTITPNSAGGIVAFSWTGLLKLAANDVVGVSNRSGNILRIYQGHSNFSGHLIG